MGNNMKQTVIKRAIVVPLLIIYIAILVWLIVFKLYWPPLQTMRSLNVIPFAQSMVNWQGEVQYAEIIFNLVVFIPFGVLLGILMKGKNLPAILFPIFLSTLCIEMIQYVFRIGATDITDIIMNTVGGAVGIGLVTLVGRLAKKTE